MVYKGSNETYDFRKFKSTHVFGNKIRNNVINMSMSNDGKDLLLRRINEFKSKTRPQNSESKKVKGDVLNSTRALLTGRKMVFKAFENGIFLKPEELKQSKKGAGIKILTPKQIKAGNNPESLLNEIRQIVYSLYQ